MLSTVGEKVVINPITGDMWSSLDGGIFFTFSQLDEWWGHNIVAKDGSMYNLDFHFDYDDQAYLYVYENLGDELRKVPIDVEFVYNDTDFTNAQFSEYEYSIGSMVVWGSFDFGTVKAVSLPHARELAEEEVKQAMKDMNAVLEPIGHSIDCDLGDLRVELKA